jgi:uncharacterized membrane protein
MKTERILLIGVCCIMWAMSLILIGLESGLGWSFGYWLGSTLVMLVIFQASKAKIEDKK